MPTASIQETAKSLFRRFFERNFEFESGSVRRLTSMEGLRGLAILLVFTCHYYDIVWKDLPAQTKGFKALGAFLLTAGGTGVDLFFILSGFLIYGAVRKPQFRLSVFLSRRAQRIYPAFLCIFVFYLAVSPFLSNVHAASERYGNRIPSGFPDSVIYVLANLAFLPGVFSIQPIMNVAWSLSYEALFYICLPVLILLTSLHRRTRPARIATIAGLGGLFLTANLLFPAFFYMPSNLAHPSHVRALMFFGGMLIYEWIESGQNTRSKIFTTRSKVFALDGAAILVSVIALLFAGAGWRGEGASIFDALRREAWVTASLLVGYSALVLVTLKERTQLCAIFSRGPIRWLGNMSYSFYLIHGIPLHVFGILAARLMLTNLPPALVWTVFLIAYPFVFIATSACAGLLFIFVEKKLSFVKRPGLREVRSALPMANLSRSSR